MKTKFKLISLIVSVFLLLNISCNIKSEKLDNSLEYEKEIINFEPNSKCFESINLDSLGLKLGNVNNLDIYNGIKYFRLGDSINLYNDCIECNSKGNRMDTCKIKDKDFMFLDKTWEGDLYFFEGKLAQLHLFRDEYSMTETYGYLETIFGSKNETEVYTSDLMGEKFDVGSKKKNNSVIYSENLQDIYDLFKDKDKDEKKTLESIELYTEDNGFEKVFNSPFKVIVKYHPVIKFSFIWKSKKGIILEHMLKRESKFHPLMTQQKSRITLSRTYTSNIYLSANEDIIIIFNQEYARNKNKIDSLEKANELKEKEKLLNKF